MEAEALPLLARSCSLLTSLFSFPLWSKYAFNYFHINLKVSFIHSETTDKKMLALKSLSTT